MRDKDRQVAESMFDRYQRRESELDDVLKQERARHDAAVSSRGGVPSWRPCVPRSVHHARPFSRQ
jgi:hypothetical protein